MTFDQRLMVRHAIDQAARVRIARENESRCELRLLAAERRPRRVPRGIDWRAVMDWLAAQ